MADHDDGAAPVRLLRRPGGYLLDIEPARVDVLRFESLVDRGQGYGLSDSDRVTVLGEALSLWRGEPLAGVAGSWAERTRQSWHVRYLTAVQAWSSAELAMNNPGVVIAPLSELVGEHPFVEPLVAVLMRALCAVGRGGEALRLYTTTRQRLVEELAMEPGPELRQVQHAILRNDLDDRDRPSVALSTPIIPAQLPRDVAGFTGRHTQLTRLDTILAAATCAQGTAVPIAAVAGTAGVGKTALAVHWAHRMVDSFPDGQLYVNLRGFDPGGQMTNPAEAIRGFLDALQVEPQRIPAGLDAQAALYRSQLAGRRMLILLDNARNSGQVRPLLPGTPGCLVLVTSRNQLSGLIAAEGAHPITLNLLTAAEAEELLAHRIGLDRVTAEPGAVKDIITACARLPLALAIVAARASGNPTWSLTILARALYESHDRLDALASGDDVQTDVRAVLSWSYEALTSPAARLFRLLGLHPGQDISVPAAASLAGDAVATVRGLLAELAHTNLIVEHVPGRYSFHDLLNAFAANLGHIHDCDEQRRDAIGRLLDHYVHTADAADRLLHPVRQPLCLATVRPLVTAEHLTDYPQALAWFTAEHPVLLATVYHAAATGFDTHAWQLTLTISNFLEQRGHWHDGAAIWHAAITVAHRLSDPLAQARAHRGLAGAHTKLERLEDAHIQLQHAVNLAIQAGDQVEQSRAHHQLAYLRERQGRYSDALDHARQALGLLQATGHQRGQAHALNAVGWCHSRLGDYQHALTTCQQALALFQELDDHYGQAFTWDSLGFAHHHLGHHAKAIACYQHAMDMFQDHGSGYSYAITLTRLGDTHHATKDLPAARNVWQHALTILKELDHPDAEQVRTKLATLDTPT